MTDLPEQDFDDAWPPFRVLCVDDVRDCADSAALLFRAMGLESRARYDGPGALDASESFRPGVCFLDLNMPGMGGDEVAKRLLARPGWRPLLLVAMTGASDEASRARVEAAGFHMHLAKPVEPRKLIEVVDALLRATQSAKGAPRGLHEPGSRLPGNEKNAPGL